MSGNGGRPTQPAGRLRGIGLRLAGLFRRAPAGIRNTLVPRRGTAQHQDLLAALAATHQLVQTLETDRRTMAREARRAGHTWKEIGDALGTSRQNAHKIYGRTLEPDDPAKAKPKHTPKWSELLDNTGARTGVIREGRGPIPLPDATDRAEPIGPI